MNFNRSKYKREFGIEKQYALDSWHSRYDAEDDWHLHDSYCECELCFGYTFDYINMGKFQYNHMMIVQNRLGGKSINRPSLYGSYVDMESIYTKDELRDRKIDILLGNVESKPKIGDLYPNLKY